ncbi:DUF6233 domain-containing protein [Streptomyces goshikiensis]|uniref:DUF6233 domain-containing protein n=1 Tax=Streptomyces goshikiensis TaxID=1942 RepID=UPI00368872E6
MSELPPDLPRLQTVVTYLRAELSRAERALAVAEERAAEASGRRPPPEPAVWLVEHGIGVGRRPVRVHVGGCWDTSQRCAPVSAEQARRALTDGVPECPHCRPDTVLGVLD